MGIGDIAKGKNTKKKGQITVKQQLAKGAARKSQAADKGMPRKTTTGWWKGAIKRALSKGPAMKRKTKHQEALDAAQGKK